MHEYKNNLYYKSELSNLYSELSKAQNTEQREMINAKIEALKNEYINLSNQ